MTFDDRVSPPLRDLVGKSMLLVCEDGNAMPMKMCAPITSESLTFSLGAEEIGFTAGGVMGVLCLILLVGGIGSAYCYGKMNGGGDEKGTAAAKGRTDHRFAALGGRSPSATMPDEHPTHAAVASTSYDSP